ncbi:MAG: hypothetical protein QGH94_06835 [Phycisphaerae bacterium]|jgi:hypothetical protein|nr:hypothetical protein [Phycisphaerae bacterium]MDP7287690.1 hypothetical protein [Phycisphaerae bacterium]
MFRYCILVLTGILVSTALVGCKTDVASGTRMSLGDVSYSEAHTIGREVMRKHFELAPSNPSAQVIAALPKPVDARAQRILGGKSPTRQLATLRLQPQEGHIVANVSVLLQRQGSASYEQFGASGNYSTIPNDTPSQGTAATTPEQNEAWETRGHDKLLERTIIQELYDAMHPGGNR